MPNYVDRFSGQTPNTKITLWGRWFEQDVLQGQSAKTVLHKTWAVVRPSASAGPLGFIIAKTNTEYTEVSQQIIMRFNKFWRGYEGQGKPTIMRWDLEDPLARILIGKHVDVYVQKDFDDITSVQFIGRQQGVRLTV